ncbi:MAG: hypothetical protein M3Y27_01760 [Acidobacteriota bacterium]|nr:hypothetical protein [Acidobacteriota bacterium]
MTAARISFQAGARLLPRSYAHDVLQTAFGSKARTYHAREFEHMDKETKRPRREIVDGQRRVARCTGCSISVAASKYGQLG